MSGWKDHMNSKHRHVPWYGASEELQAKLTLAALTTPDVATSDVTDQGQTFNGKLFTALCKEAKILKLRTSPYHPQTNGQPERFNHTLMTMLGTLPEDKKINWQDWVSTLCHTYNCTVTKVTGYSPYFLMFGHQPRIPVDKVFDVTFPKTNRNTMKQYVQTLQKRLEWVFEIVKEHIEKEVGRRKLFLFLGKRTPLLCLLPMQVFPFLTTLNWFLIRTL